MSNTKFTPGPWRWEFNQSSRQVRLCGGVPRYDLTVIDFVRYGMHGAVPRFREPEKDGLNIMHRVEYWGSVVPGREHHQSWFQSVNHPDAALIAQAPELYALVCEYLDTLKSDYEGKEGRDLTGGRIAAVEAVLAKVHGEVRP